MKTITENATNLSKYLFEDSKAVNMGSDKITVGDPSAPDFYIADLNSSNATLTENVTNSPSDWTGNKYTFDGTTWTQDPNWVEPETP
jgi:hypothetical protein